MLEVCVDNIESAINAASGGASRIELCSALSEGGLTPSIGILKTIKQIISIPVFVMLRPRRGDFIYSEEEISSMEYDATLFKNAGADGFVFGVLHENGKINTSACQRILQVITPAPATFHRAFDVAVSPLTTLNVLIELGFRRVLTSGKKKNAAEGVELIKQLVQIADNKIIVMAGSGINVQNVRIIVTKTGVKEVHGSARSSATQLRSVKNYVSLDSTDFGGELLVTDINTVKNIVIILNTLSGVTS